jgi:hypothetical protein
LNQSVELDVDHIVAEAPSTLAGSHTLAVSTLDVDHDDVVEIEPTLEIAWREWYTLVGSDSSSLLPCSARLLHVRDESSH